MKKILGPVAAALVIAGFSTSALAVCDNAGTIAEVNMVDDGVGTVHTILFRTGALADHVYSVDTDDDEMAEAAVALHVSQQRVFVGGDAATCPLSGVMRLVGNLTFLNPR